MMTDKEFDAGIQALRKLAPNYFLPEPRDWDRDKINALINLLNTLNLRIMVLENAAARAEEKMQS